MDFFHIWDFAVRLYILRIGRWLDKFLVSFSLPVVHKLCQNNNYGKTFKN